MRSIKLSNRFSLLHISAEVYTSYPIHLAQVKAPTRRVIASTVGQIVPILNSHSEQLDKLIEKTNRLEAEEFAFHRHNRSLWARLRWLVTGR